MKNNVISRWAEHDQIIKDTISMSPLLGNTKIAIKIDYGRFNSGLNKLEIDSLRKYISRNRERLTGMQIAKNKVPLHFLNSGEGLLKTNFIYNTSNVDILTNEIRFNPEFVKEFNKPIEQLENLFLPSAKDLSNSGIIKHIKAPLKQSKLFRKFKPFTTGDPNNILFIGDIHAPFDLDDYVKFCYDQQIKYNCGKVVFIGDVIDNHFSSYHESDPDGYSAGEELDRAINRLADYYFTFPIATVIVGNHDRLVYRKAFSAGVSKRWIKDYKDVLDTPKWNFVESIELFGININHGEGGTAKNRIKKELQSQIQGHLHSEFYVEYLVGAKFIIFGMQVGCGVDNKSYAMAYGKNYKKPAIGCGVLLENGTLPVLIPMKM